jgi:hypothetical protein
MSLLLKLSHVAILLNPGIQPILVSKHLEASASPLGMRSCGERSHAAAIEAAFAEAAQRGAALSWSLVMLLRPRPQIAASAAQYRLPTSVFTATMFSPVV